MSFLCKMQVIFTIGTLTAPLHNWLFIYKLGMGLMGSAVALGVINAGNSLLLVAYIAWHNRRLQGTPEDPWPGW